MYIKYSTLIYIIKLHTYSVIQQKLHVSKLNHGIYLSYNLFLKVKQYEKVIKRFSIQINLLHKKLNLVHNNTEFNLLLKQKTLYF